MKVRRVSLSTFPACVCFWASIGHLAIVSVGMAQERPGSLSLHGVLVDGHVVEAPLDGEGRLTEGHALTDFRSLKHPAQPFDSAGSAPVRLLTLATGERVPVRLSGEWSSESRDVNAKVSTRARFLLAGQDCAVPVRSIASVSVPTGSRDIVFGGSPLSDDFWTFRKGDVTRVAVQGGAVTVPASGWLRRDIVPTGGPLFVEMSVAWPVGDKASLEFLFGSSSVESRTANVADSPVESGIRLSLEGDRIVISRLGAIRVAIATSSVLRADLAEHSKLRLTIDNGLTLSLSGRVLARGSRSPGTLRSIVVRASPMGGKSTAPHDATAEESPVAVAAARAPVVQSCLIQTRSEAPVDESRESPSGDQITVETHADDVLYGDALRLNSENVRLKTQFGAVSLSWPEVRRVALPRPSPEEMRPVSGDVCRLWLASDAATTFFGVRPAFTLTGSVQLTGSAVRVQHPLLRTESTGTDDAITLPWASVHRIEPLFRGEYRLLDSGPRHLGRLLQRSFARPVPDGTAWPLHFVLTEVPSGRAFLSMDAAELEPASPTTLRATPELAELRRGFLTTNVLLNEFDAGSLNRHCEFRSPIDRPERLRVPLPLKFLKQGLNVIQLRQNPSRDDPERFDDCELRRIAIEFER